MDCSNGECVSLEKAFTEDNFDSVETLIKKKLSGLTEFEQELAWIICEWGNSEETKISNFVKKYATKLLALAKKELCRGCNANIEGYIKGRDDAEKRYNESVAYHYPDPVPPGVAYKSPQCYTDVMVTPNINSGTSTLKAEG